MNNMSRIHKLIPCVIFTSPANPASSANPAFLSPQIPPLIAEALCFFHNVRIFLDKCEGDDFRKSRYALNKSP